MTMMMTMTIEERRKAAEDDDDVVVEDDADADAASFAGVDDYSRASQMPRVRSSIQHCHCLDDAAERCRCVDDEEEDDSQ
jgi:hypothetical protein